jgi:hypothetical protein
MTAGFVVAVLFGAMVCLSLFFRCVAAGLNALLMVLQDFEVGIKVSCIPHRGEGFGEGEPGELTKEK